jgi:hypothetical protein
VGILDPWDLDIDDVLGKGITDVNIGPVGIALRTRFLVG